MTPPTQEQCADLESKREHARNVLRRLHPGTRESYVASFLDEHYSFTVCLGACRERRAKGLAENGMLETEDTELQGEMIAALIALPRPPNVDGDSRAGPSPDWTAGEVWI